MSRSAVSAQVVSIQGGRQRGALGGVVAVRDRTVATREHSLQPVVRSVHTHVERDRSDNTHRLHYTHRLHDNTEQGIRQLHNTHRLHSTIIQTTGAADVLHTVIDVEPTATQPGRSGSGDGLRGRHVVSTFGVTGAITRPRGVHAAGLGTDPAPLTTTPTAERCDRLGCAYRQRGGRGEL